MKKFSLALTFFALAILGTVVPQVNVSYAQVTPTNPPGETTYEQAYVPCGYADINDSQGNRKETNVAKPGETPVILLGDGVVDNPCKFTHIIELAKKLIMGWIIAGVIIATMGFAYAGLLYITSMGSTEKISHAHSIFIKTFWGFVFMLSAWLIAYTMETIFLSDAAKKNSFLLEKAP